jgi:hypothetical protein
MKSTFFCPVLAAFKLTGKKAKASQSNEPIVGAANFLIGNAGN